MQTLMKIRKDATTDTVTVVLKTVALKQQRKQLESPVLIEVLLGLLVTTGGGYLILASLGSSQLVFCLFCLFIFAIAIRANRRVAYSNGFIAALGYAFLIWHAAGMDLHLFLQANFLTPPFLLIVVSILGSDLLYGQRVRLHAAEMQLQHTKEKQVQLSQQLEKVLESKKELQQQFFEQEAPIASVCYQLTQLWQLNNEERYSAIVALVVQATGANSSALYVENGNQFSLQASHSVQNISYPTTLNKDDLLIEKVLQHAQVCTIRDMPHDHKGDTYGDNNHGDNNCRGAIDKPAMMAGPLSKGKHLLGIVIVGAMPLTKFTLSTTQLFSALLQLVSISLQEPIPSPASNTIDLQVMLKNEKNQQLKKVLDDEKTQVLKKVRNNENIPHLKDSTEEEETQKFTNVKHKHMYTHK